MGADQHYYTENMQRLTCGAAMKLIGVLRPYMELREAQGIGHSSKQGKALAEAWKEYVKATNG